MRPRLSVDNGCLTPMGQASKRFLDLPLQELTDSGSLCDHGCLTPIGQASKRLLLCRVVLTAAHCVIKELDGSVDPGVDIR